MFKENFIFIQMFNKTIKELKEFETLYNMIYQTTLVMPCSN